MRTPHLLMTFAVLYAGCLVGCVSETLENGGVGPPTVAPTHAYTAISPSGTGAVSTEAQPRDSATPAQSPRPTFPTSTQLAESATTSPIDRMMMVHVPAGPFTMGSSEEQIDYALANCIHDVPDYECLRSWFISEQPARLVTLGEYWIDRTEVTNTAFAVFLNDVDAPEDQMEGPLLTWSSASRLEYTDGEWHVKPPYAEHPIAGVTWYGAQAYCEWAGRRLPTEAEWEKAARGTDGRIFPWGNDDATCLLANYGGCVGETTPVGSYPNGTSPYGAVDMAGNVWEWVQDWYQGDYYAIAPDTDAPGPLQGSERVLRGGWAMGDPRNSVYIRTTVRYFNAPTSSDTAFGFRCATGP